MTVDTSSGTALSLLLLAFFLTGLVTAATSYRPPLASPERPLPLAGGRPTYADLARAALAVATTALALWLLAHADGRWSWPLGAALGLAAWAGGHLLAPALAPLLARLGHVRAVAAIQRLLACPLPLGRRRYLPFAEVLASLTGQIPSPAQAAMIRAVMDLGTTTVREVMVPRIDMVAVEAEADLREVAETMVRRGYSRLPVYEGTIDNIIGVVHAREVLRRLVDGAGSMKVRELARPAHFVPETKRLVDLLPEMQRQRISIAIVVDEYGGTAGLVTVEDLLEEIVGELVDEFDVEEEPVQRLGEDEVAVDARVGVEILEELFGIRVEGEEFETVGGFIYHRLGKVPTVGDQVELDDLVLQVLSVTGRRIRRVRIARRRQALAP